MRFLFLFVAFCCHALVLAQVDSAALPAPVLFADSLPALGNCGYLETAGAQDSCTQTLIFRYLSEAVQYPEKARQENTQGSVVVQFIIETDGKISNIRCIKDIGNGCGEEAVRAISAMNSLGAWWKPAVLAGKKVRYQYTVPVRFKLEIPLPYAFSGTDTVYTELSAEASFRGGDAAFEAFKATHLKHPAVYKDSCKADVFQASILVRLDSTIEVMEIYELGGNGFQYEFEGIAFLLSTAAQWKPGEYDGRPVNSVASLRFLMPAAAACKALNDKVANAETLYESALNSPDSSTAEALTAIGSALKLWPNNAEYKYLQGTLQINAGNYTAACEDLTAVKQQLKKVWFDEIMQVTCLKALEQQKGKAPK